MTVDLPQDATIARGQQPRQPIQENHLIAQPSTTPQISSNGIANGHTTSTNGVSADEVANGNRNKVAPPAPTIENIMKSTFQLEDHPIDQTPPLKVSL